MSSSARPIPRPWDSYAPVPHHRWLSVIHSCPPSVFFLLTYLHTIIQQQLQVHSRKETTNISFHYKWWQTQTMQRQFSQKRCTRGFHYRCVHKLNPGNMGHDPATQKRCNPTRIDSFLQFMNTRFHTWVVTQTTLLASRVVWLQMAFSILSSVGTVTETGTETAVFWQNRTEAKPRF